MNAEGYALPPTSRLRTICIAQIVLGVVAVIAAVFQQAPSYKGWSVFQFACGAFLLFTGGHGFHAIRRLRMQILDRKAFRILSACNVVLCINYSIAMLLLLYALARLEEIPTSTRVPPDSTILANTTADEHVKAEAMENWRIFQELLDVEISKARRSLITSCIIAILLEGVFVACTATAAYMSYRLSVSMLASSQQPGMIPAAGVPLIGGGPGYGTYPAVPIEPLPTYMSYPSDKQDFS